MKTVSYGMDLYGKLRERIVELESAKQAAEYANRVKSDLVANLSHELRAPLNAIIGFSNIMLQDITGRLTEQQLDYLKDIRKSGFFLLSLVNNILDLSKIEAGKIELELGEVIVEDVIRESMVLFKEKAMKQRIMLMSEIAPDVGPFEADEIRLKQVVVNLLSNAVKFTPEGGSVQVTAAKVNSEQLKRRKLLSTDDYSITTNGNFVEISVSDTGIGIRPVDIDKLFLPYHRVKSSTINKYEGTGLGLALSKRIVELHRGKIWVESVIGRGSTFAFLIPVKQ